MRMLAITVLLLVVLAANEILKEKLGFSHKAEIYDIIVSSKIAYWSAKRQRANPLNH